MNIVDRRPNPKGKSLSNRQRFLGARPRRGQVGGAGGACASARSPMSSTARRWRSRRAGSPSRCFTTAGAPAAPSMSSPATRNTSAATRSRGRSGGEGRGGREGSPDGVGRGRLRVHAVEGRVPRHVLRGSRTARPGQEEPARRPSRSICSAPATPSPARRPISASPRTMRNSMARRISLRRPKPSEIEALREALEEARAARRRGGGGTADARARTHRAPQQDHPLHRPDRCPLSTASSGCRGRTPRQSCSA